MNFKFLLGTYKWVSWSEFWSSLFPSHQSPELFVMTISAAGLIAKCSNLLGLGDYSILALIVMLVLELTSGIYCSLWIRNEKFESKKLSRFGFKVILLIGVLFIGNSLQREATEGIKQIVFGNINDFIVIYSMCEILISVLENKAEIEGKEKDYYSKIVKEKIDKLIGRGQ